MFFISLLGRGQTWNNTEKKHIDYFDIFIEWFFQLFSQVIKGATVGAGGTHTVKLTRMTAFIGEAVINSLQYSSDDTNNMMP